MTKTHFRLGALLILAVILLHNLTSPDRYSIQTVGSGLMKTDHVTGKVWRYSTKDDGDKWREI